MIDVWGIPLVVLWLAWMTQAVLSVLLVRRFWIRLRKPWRPQLEARTAFRATIIMPMKGLDPGIAHAIDNLCTQDHPNYRLIFVVESDDDPAHDLVTCELARHPAVDARVIVAGRAGPRVGQKVHNQLQVLKVIEPDSGDDEYWVFADSDAVPGPTWLTEMIRPLAYVDKIGMTTGYRWLVPEAKDVERGVSIWSHVASVINASVACTFALESHDQAWGGSMALRVATARRGGLLDRLDGALTDDYVMARMCRQLGLHVYFVRKCLVATPASFHLSQLVNFGHRQYLLTRVYEPRLFRAALGITSLYLAGFVSAWAWLIYQVIRGSLIDCSGPLVALAFVHIASHVRTIYRRRVIDVTLGPAMVDRLRTTLRVDRWLTTVCMAVHWLLVVRGALGRRMNWRGIEYELRGPNDVQRREG